MKIALVHDYIKEYGGAERVLETLHEIYPDAPVYTTVYLPDYLGPHKERFSGWDIRTSFLQALPFKAKLISPFRLISSLAFQQFDFSEYDVVIVSATGAYFPNSIRVQGTGVRGQRTKHITYCHTPPRYLYGYATARNWKKNRVLRVIGEIANHFLRMIDFKSAQHVDQFIANSEEVKARIKRFYRKEAVVIYPPVEISSSPRTRGSSSKNTWIPDQVGNDKGYYIAGGRLARAKHIDLIVRVCAENNIPLKVFGKGFGGAEGEILRNKGIKILSAAEKNNPNISISQYPNILYYGEISDEQKWELLAGAKAYIFAGEDEDFGILPVEAMAAGTPVIAYKSGGVKETVVDGKTGIFFEELKETSLLDAIRKFEKKEFDSIACQQQAEKFSKERFIQEIGTLVKKHHQ